MTADLSWVRLRRRTWEIGKAARPDDRLGQRFDIFIMALIFLNVLMVIIGTVDGVNERYGAWLWAFEVVSVIIFTIEYVLRVWLSVASADYGASGAILGCARFAMTPMAIIDLLAILPFYLAFLGVDLRILRALHFMRILRIAKLGRYLPALKSLRRVLRNKREELVISFTVLLLLWS